MFQSESYMLNVQPTHSWGYHPSDKCNKFFLTGYSWVVNTYQDILKTERLDGTAIVHHDIFKLFCLFSNGSADKGNHLES